MSALLRDETVYSKVSGVVDTSFFNSPVISDLFLIVKDFYVEYSRTPMADELLHLYKKGKASVDSTVDKYVDALYFKKVDSVFVLTELNRYVKLRQLENLFKIKYEEVKLGKDIDTSNVVMDLFKIQMDSLKDRHIYGVGIDETEHIIEEGESQVCVPTNIQYLNQLMDGGLRGGQLGIVLAPSNYGKTWALLNFAIYAFLKGRNVLFVTLEMPVFSIIRRILLLVRGALGIDANVNTLRQLTAKLGKKFMILYKPSYSIGVDYLYSVYHQAQADGIDFDCVYIDYADLLKASSFHKEKRFELSNIFGSLNSTAQLLDVPVWSATQSNREGFKAKTVEAHHVSEDISKIFISDVVVTINDKISTNSVIRLFLAKSREGSSDSNIDVFVNDQLWFREDTGVESSVSLDNI